MDISDASSEDESELSVSEESYSESSMDWSSATDGVREDATIGE